MYSIDNFNPFRDECHAASVKAGWWKGVYREDEHDHGGTFSSGLVASKNVHFVIPTKLCLIHSEISEMDEGYFNGAHDEHLPEFPSALVEAGDTIIRIGDLAGYCELDMTAAIAMIRQADYVEALLDGTGQGSWAVQATFRYLHRFVSAAMEGYRKSAMDRSIPVMAAFPANLARVVILIDEVCNRNGWNLAEAAAAKIAYNAVRLDHKAEVRAQSGGKTF